MTDEATEDENAAVFARQAVRGELNHATTSLGTYGTQAQAQAQAQAAQIAQSEVRSNTVQGWHAYRDQVGRDTLRQQAVDLTEALIASGHIIPVGVPTVLGQIYAALESLGAPKPETETTSAAAEPPKPAVPIKKSITDERIISLIDGKPRQTLTRHLKLKGHTPASYRAAYGLPKSYPMVAPNYSRKRQGLAKAMGLGTKPKEQPAAAEAAAAH